MPRVKNLLRSFQLDSLQVVELPSAAPSPTSSKIVSTGPQSYSLALAIASVLLLLTLWRSPQVHQAALELDSGSDGSHHLRHARHCARDLQVSDHGH